jgi:hypothetical protein
MYVMIEYSVNNDLMLVYSRDVGNFAWINYTRKNTQAVVTGL